MATKEGFTDDDLKRLKEEIRQSQSANVEWWSALLARLDAAEGYAWAYDPANGKISKDWALEKKEDWLASKGESV